MAADTRARTIASFSVTERSTEGGSDRRSWKTVSFPSTLHLQPVLDILLSQIPVEYQPEVRLGLQEALVNAAKHGNALDPQKSVCVKYKGSNRDHCWIIADEGAGFSPPQAILSYETDDFPCEHQECGRGLFILHQVFDEVCWNADGTALMLYKRHQPARALMFAGCSSA
ncbi:MAG: ATP-binding protein [Synechococcales cyanobacterium RU_4_20]|nr:ATP-binding protein [Synechococcales cyanobacterium RU_4_20]